MIVLLESLEMEIFNVFSKSLKIEEKQKERSLEKVTSIEKNLFI